MKNFFKKSNVSYIGLLLVIAFSLVQTPHVSAMDFCLTNPWGPGGEDQRCSVTATIALATNPVTSGGSTNITVTGDTRYQWSTGGFGFYSVTLTNAAGTIINSWFFDGGFDFPPAGGPMTFNSGPITEFVTVEFCAMSAQRVTTCTTSLITVAPTVEIHFSLLGRVQELFGKIGNFI